MSISKRQFLMRLGVALSVAPLSGCVGQSGGWFNPQSSLDAAKLPTPVAEAIATDMAVNLGQKIGPGLGTIWLKGSGSTFDLALVNAMQGRGYAVAVANQPPGGEKVIPLTYAVDQVGSQIYVRITTPTVELSRSYIAMADSAAPAGSISILTHASAGEPGDA